jgi:XTP/dITP diphosphohydrolase
MSNRSENAELREIERLLEVVRKLRAECPWDRVQNVSSTARHLIEEAYEVADAIASNDNAEIAEELGDAPSKFLSIQACCFECLHIAYFDPIDAA